MNIFAFKILFIFFLLIFLKMMLDDRTFDYLVYYGMSVLCLVLLVYLVLRRDVILEGKKKK